MQNRGRIRACFQGWYLIPKHPLISIPLDIPDVRVIQTERHGVDEPRLLRHLPILGRVAYLRIRPKRFRCPWCDGHPTTTQQLDWYDPNALHTKAYERQFILQLVNSTVTDVQAKEDVTYAALLGILDRWITTTVDWDALEPFAALGIDEIALVKGQRDFVAIISAQTEHGDLHVLAVLPDRLKTTILAWLLTIPQTIRQRDCWLPPGSGSPPRSSKPAFGNAAHRSNS